MSETLQNQRQFNSQFEHQEIHHGKRYSKKRCSWTSLIIQVFVLILTTITGYSMLKQPIFKILSVNETINFHQLKNFQDTVTQIGNLNLGNIDQLQQSIDNLIIIFNIFFVLYLISLFITVTTIVFNHTTLEIVNILLLAIMLVITLYFSYIIRMIAQRISESLKQCYLTIPPEQVLTEADAIHNALILVGCSIALLIVSLFFHNRLPRIK